MNEVREPAAAYGKRHFTIEEYLALNEVMLIQSIDAALPLAEVYEDVTM